MTTKQPYPDEFKIEPVKQITERGHRVADVSARSMGRRRSVASRRRHRSRLWSGRYFSRTVGVGGTNRLQYMYVRGPKDVLTFLQPTVATTLPCVQNPGGTPLPDFATVERIDGKLKQFVVGTSTASTALCAQRRLNIGQPGAMVTYTPIAKPTNATARCILPA